MSDLLDALGQNELAPPEPTQRELVRQRQQQEVERIEDKLLDEATEVVSGAMAFHEIDGLQEGEIPVGWEELYGRAGAERRVRIARLGMLPSSDAPIGLSIASRVASSVMSAKAKRQKVVAPVLRLEVANLNLIQKEYPVIDVTEAGRKR